MSDADDTEDTPLPVITAATITAELEAVTIGHSDGGLFIPRPLIVMVAGYAAPFVSEYKQLTSFGNDESILGLAVDVNTSEDENENAFGGERERERWVIATDRWQFMKYSLKTGRSVHFCGKNAMQFTASGNRLSVGFVDTEGVPACIDPIRPKCWYLSDSVSVRHFDEAADEVTLVALPVNSALYCTTPNRQNRSLITRFDTGSGAIKQYDLGWSHIPAHILCTLSGHILFSGGHISGGLGALDPHTGVVERVDTGRHRSGGSGSGGDDIVPFAARIVLIDSTRTLVVADHQRLSLCTLPPQYFPLPNCCDRDRQL